MIIKQVIKYTNADAIEATWVDENDVVIKCHAYNNHPEQMAMLRADLGADAAQYEGMIAEVEATYVPPEPEPVYVPQQITRAQGKAAIIMQGHWQEVLDCVASIQDPTQRALAEVALNDTLTWERSSPFFNAAVAELGMTDEQLDALFIQASEITL